jgi:hypothetical protein
VYIFEDLKVVLLITMERNMAIRGQSELVRNLKKLENI